MAPNFARALAAVGDAPRCGGQILTAAACCSCKLGRIESPSVDAEAGGSTSAGSDMILGTSELQALSRSMKFEKNSS